MFKPNDIIVCIDKEINYASNDGKMDGLTIGKKYQSKFIKHHYTYDMIHFINDHSTLGSYYDYRFISLLEYRKRKIKKICLKLEMK